MAYSEDEADDEYERSIRNASPSIGDSEASPSDSDASSSAHLTPTTFARAAMADNLPEAIVTEWTAEECGEFMGNLGLRQYTDLFLGMWNNVGVTSGRRCIVSGRRLIRDRE